MNECMFAEQANGPSAREPRPLNVVVVDEELPYPQNSGKRIRTLQLLLRLAHRHRLTYLCHRNRDPRETEAAVEYLADHGIATVLADESLPSKSVGARGARFYGRLAANLFSPLPYTVSANNSKALRATIRNHASQAPVDIWQCEWTPYAESLRGVVGGRQVVMAHNIESQIWQRYHETETSMLKRWYIGQQWKKFRSFERRVFGEVDRVVTVSPPDATLAQDDFGCAHPAVVDNGVDVDYFQPGDGPRDPRKILFLGSLDWRANLDAVRLLLTTIFPAVQAEMADARLSIVGRDPPSWLSAQVNGMLGVELAGSVPDVRPFLHQCGVMAVPLRIGGGSRLKILEAMATALPVVSTRVGAEGLSLRSGEHLDVVERPEEMVQPLLKAMRHPEPARAMAMAGREHILRHYSWDSLADRLEEIWLDCAGCAFAK